MKRWIKHAIFGMALGGCVQQEATSAPTVETAEASICPAPGNYTKVDPLKTTKFDGKLLRPQSDSQHWLSMPDPRTKGVTIAALVDVDKGTVVQAVTFDSTDLNKVHAAVPIDPFTDHFHPPPPPPPPIGDKYMTALLLEVGLADTVTLNLGYNNVGLPHDAF